MDPPLGIHLPSVDHTEYYKKAKDALEKAEQHVKTSQYDFLSRWVLWYYDNILFTFFFFDRNRMYDAMNTSLMSEDFIEARRLLEMVSPRTSRASTE